MSFAHPLVLLALAALPLAFVPGGIVLVLGAGVASALWAPRLP